MSNLLRSAFAMRRLTVVAFLSCLSAVAVAQQATPYLLWPTPAPIQYLSPLTNVQLDAVALAGPPVGVPLSANFNVEGIVTPGTTFAGGFDGNGESFSAAELGTAVRWKGVDFPLGPANTLNVVSGGSVALPSGSYSSLLLLADLVNDVQPGTGSITVHYTDGSVSTSAQAFSDWVRARNNPGESTVTCVASRVFYNGAVEPNSTCVYGYSVALDPSKTVASVDLPDNRNIVVLSMALLPPVLQGQIAYSPAAGTYPPIGTSNLLAMFSPQDSATASVSGTVPLVVDAPNPPLLTHVTWATPTDVSVGTVLGPSQLDATAAAYASPVAVDLINAARVNAFFHDGRVYRATGFDGQNAAYSYEQLGTELHYHGATFTLGSPDVQDAASSDIIAVPPGAYTELYLLGAATQTSPGQIFTLQYADGTTGTQTVDMSAWTDNTTFPDETVAATTTVQNLSDGTQRAAQARVYGYTLPVDSTRTLQAVTLPTNPAVVILAAGVDTGQSVPVQGSFVYTPPAGTAVAQGNTTLHVDFTPDNAGVFAPSQGDVALHVLRPVLAVRADDATRMYGAANPIFTGSVTGAIGGDVFRESYSTTATQFSAPGTYPLVPAVVNGNVGGYSVEVYPAVLSVTRATTLVSLDTTSGGIAGSTVTLTSTVASTTSGVPTGVVTFLANGTAVGSAAIVQGVAALSTNGLPVGDVSVVASYGGDTNFLPSGSTPTSIQVRFRDFALSALQGTVLQGTMGTSPSLPFHIAPLDGTYSADAVFTVSGDLPPGTYATFSPSKLAINGGAQDVIVTLHTRTLASASEFFHTGRLVSFAALIGLLPFARLRRKRSMDGGAGLTCLAVAAALLAATTLSGCGTGYAAHTYLFNVVATTGQVSHTLPLTLQIQASPQ